MPSFNMNIRNPTNILVIFTNNAKIIWRVNIIRITLNNPKLTLLMKITRTSSGYDWINVIR